MCFSYKNINVIAYIIYPNNMSESQQYTLSKFHIIKNLVSLSAATSGVVAVNCPTFLLSAVNYINAYVFLDLFFARRDMVLHHLLVLSFFAATKMHEYPEDFKVYLMNNIIRVEYSNIFYSGGPLLLHYLSTHKNTKLIDWLPIIKKVVHILFAITFFKYRIYDFSGKVIFRAETYSPKNFTDLYACFHLITTLWIFYSLNLYWLQLIIMKFHNLKRR